jgi:hypothetical protein
MLCGTELDDSVQRFIVRGGGAVPLRRDRESLLCGRYQARHVPSLAAPFGAPANGAPTSFSTRGPVMPPAGSMQRERPTDEIAPCCCTTVYQAVPMLAEEEHDDGRIGTVQNTIGTAAQAWSPDLPFIPGIAVARRSPPHAPLRRHPRDGVAG